jgi:FAD/FMN-containing dehydrogenase
MTIQDAPSPPARVRAPRILVNDEQSQLNPTRVRRIVRPASEAELQAAFHAARREGVPVSIAGGRHSMGGQQFGRDTVLLDMRGMDRVLHFDRARGLVTAEAGIQWPGLIAYLVDAQQGEPRPWGIRQKQTGVDHVTLGGSLASNVHGRGLCFPPIIGDVESFVLMDARGELRPCSRTENGELFALAIGGYGLFGVITQVTLRLVPRQVVQRVVEVVPIREVMSRFDERIADGYLYGDCQYSTDLGSEAAEHPGVFSCYRPVADSTPVPDGQRALTGEQWAQFYRLARTDKRRAFAEYARYYLSTSGQVYGSDTHQLAGSFEHYRQAVDPGVGTEVITEVYVDADNFVPLLAANRADMLRYGVDVTYGTIRLIEPDTESFLPWAPRRRVCIVCNLHVPHTPAGRRKAARDFRRIIDRAVHFGGSFFLTYHRWATRPQVEACYPRFAEFLALKRHHDPEDRFQSEWYRHYARLFA